MLPILLVTASVTLGSAPSPRLPEYPHVRAENPRIERLIEDAARRSATFARLYSLLQETDVILFVEVSHDLKNALCGRLAFMSATPAVRYLRAEIRSDLAPTDMITTIAHEMQHALEIAGTALVRDERGLAVLYRRIGTRPDTHAFETYSAQAVARRVRRELLA